jgi:hypothetical protein
MPAIHFLQASGRSTNRVSRNLKALVWTAVLISGVARRRMVTAPFKRLRSG